MNQIIYECVTYNEMLKLEAYFAMIENADFAHSFVIGIHRKPVACGCTELRKCCCIVQATKVHFLLPIFISSEHVRILVYYVRVCKYAACSQCIPILVGKVK